MSKTYDNISEWGFAKAFTSKKRIELIGLDLETIDNNLFIIGTYDELNKYKYTTNNFLDFFYNTLLEAVRSKKNIATWTRYDNTHLLKLILLSIDNEDIINDILNKAGKISAKWNRKGSFYEEPPLYTTKYKSFEINIEMIVRNCILFRIIDRYGKSRTVWSYDIRNLYTGFTIERATKDNNFTWYSKIDISAHIIDNSKFNSDKKYRDMVLESNKLDARAVMELGHAIQEDFNVLFDSYPKNLISAGSLARNAIVAMSDKLKKPLKNLNIKSIIDLGNSNHLNLLDYSMQAYHGGKIDSYILGSIKNAKMIDISSAYPAEMRELKGFVNKNIIYAKGKPKRSDYNYLFVKCNLYIKESSETFSTPFIIKNPLDNHSNLNAYGYLKEIVLTREEYKFVLDNLDKIDIEYIDHFYITSNNELMIYTDIIDILFKKRLEYKKAKLISLDNLAKTIINSLYGITYELNELYNNDLEIEGYKAGDFFNSVIASHITAGTRVKIAKMNNEILKRGGEVLLNMTDSIMYSNADVSDLTYKEKILGTFEFAEEITDVIVLGSGRYEYMKDLKYVYRTRGFTAKTSGNSYYKEVLKNGGRISNSGFVTLHKSKTKNFTYKDIGLIYDNEYFLDPFNLGGKRFINNLDKNIDLTKDYIKTEQVYLDRYLYRSEEE